MHFPTKGKVKIGSDHEAGVKNCGVPRGLIRGGGGGVMILQEHQGASSCSCEGGGSRAESREGCLSQCLEIQWNFLHCSVILFLC